MTAEFICYLIGFGILFSVSQYFCGKWYIEDLERLNKENIEKNKYLDTDRTRIAFQAEMDQEKMFFFRNIAISWIVIIAIIIIHIFFVQNKDLKGDTA